MNIPIREHLLQVYEQEIEQAYAELLQSFTDYLKEGIGDLRSMAGRCGARVGAAHKRCKRGMVFAALSGAREDGVDITPTVAENLFARLIGRGVDLRAALDEFATPGRTAANKSKVVATDLADFEAGLRPEVHSLISEMKVIRERHRDDYGERAKEAAEAAAAAGRK